MNGKASENEWHCHQRMNGIVIREWKALSSENEWHCNKRMKCIVIIEWMAMSSENKWHCHQWMNGIASENEWYCHQRMNGIVWLTDYTANRLGFCYLFLTFFLFHYFRCNCTLRLGGILLLVRLLWMFLKRGLCWKEVVRLSQTILRRNSLQCIKL